MTTQDQRKYSRNARNQSRIKLALKIIPISMGVFLLLGWAGWKGITAPVEVKSEQINKFSLQLNLV
jgi:UPF0755 protein